MERTNATELPLAICYRCPTSHVELAASIYPGIEAAPNAEPGILRFDATEAELGAGAKANDLILCRTTAPLISVCFQLIRDGFKARVRGKDIDRTLKAVVTALEKELAHEGQDLQRFDLSNFDFLNWAEIYKVRLVERAEWAGATPLNLETIKDKVETVAAIWLSASPKPRTTTEFKQLIGEIFSDTSGGVIWLST